MFSAQVLDGNFVLSCPLYWLVILVIGAIIWHMLNGRHLRH